jgi:hypothetical protein
MRLMGIRESIELLKDFLTEDWDGKETGQSGGGVGWHHSIAVATAVIAVVGALAGLLETEFIARMIMYKNDAILNQSLASDQWSYYQAKDIRRHMYDISAKIHPPRESEFRKKSAEYDSAREKIRKTAEWYATQAKKNNEESDKHYHLHLYFALSVTAFQVSIALLAVSAYTRSKRLWLFAILISVVGLGCIGFGLLQYHLVFL